MSRAQPGGERVDHRVVRPAFPRRIDQLRPDLEVGVPAGLIEIVVLHEHRRRQHDVGPAGGFGHELFVGADEQVLAREAAAHKVAVGADGERVLVLDEQRVHRRAVAEFRAVAGQHGADPAHVHHADGQIADIQPLDQRLVPVVEAAVAPQRAAALVRPGARHGRRARSPRACSSRRCASGRNRSRAGCSCASWTRTAARRPRSARPAGR